MYLIILNFTCSFCEDGAEQEESASVCEYFLQFAVMFEPSLLILRVCYPAGESLQIELQMHEEISTLIYINLRSVQRFCAFD